MTVKLLAVAAMILTWRAIAPQGITAQSQPPASQNPPAQNQQPANTQNKPATTPANNSNPFPEDETTVPVMPNRNTINLPANSGSSAEWLPLPGDDIDPVHSPDEGVPTGQSGFSSSLAGTDTMEPDTGADADSQSTGKHGRHQQAVEPEHHETASEDESVGQYYLESKDWKAALSRFESALVLDPENPDVYWGLAESDRHLGRFADARQNYQKVLEYDPGSHHAKEAGKALKDPEIANAKAVLPSTSVTPEPNSNQ